MIHHIEFSDLSDGWTLERISLQPVNLLVGISGVGKSRTLKALLSVARCATGRGPAPTECRWELDVQAHDRRYTWSVETGPRPGNAIEIDFNRLSNSEFELNQRRPAAPFQTERIIVEDRSLADRDHDQVTFSGNRAPKLKETESLISLFRNEAEIAPLYEALTQVTKSSAAEFEFTFWPTKQIQKWRRELTSLEHLRTRTGVPLIVRFDILQRLDPSLFQDVTARFIDIFDTVQEVRVGLAEDLLPADSEDEQRERLIILIVERGIKKPLFLEELSSGMRRTLRHLVELALAPDGSTLLIDEYENSLGVNCLPSITEHLVNRSRDIQVIATSHHPYVINNISTKYWRVVTRDGSHVRIRDAADIPELNTASRQDAFIRLMNSQTYQGGIRSHE